MTGSSSQPRRRAAAIVLTSAAFLAFAASALGFPPFTTAPKTSAGSGGQTALPSVSAACHSTFDRFVIRAASGTPGYDVRYVRRIVADPSGNPVSLRGTKRIRVVIHGARGHTLPAVVTPLCSNLRQVKKVGDFEGVVSFGLGLRRKTGFRVFRLTGPRRIVIDVAH
jgi:hypothetical protein